MGNGGRQSMRFFFALLFLGACASIAQAHPCDDVPVSQRFTCQNDAWIRGMFDHWRENGQSAYIDYLLGRVSCKSSDVWQTPLDRLIADCKKQLGTDFGCKITKAVAEWPNTRESLGRDALPFVDWCTRH